MRKSTNFWIKKEKIVFLWFDGVSIRFFSCSLRFFVKSFVKMKKNKMKIKPRLSI